VLRASTHFALLPFVIALAPYGSAFASAHIRPTQNPPNAKRRSLRYPKKINETENLSRLFCAWRDCLEVLAINGTSHFAFSGIRPQAKSATPSARTSLDRIWHSNLGKTDKIRDRINLSLILCAWRDKSLRSLST